MFCLNLNISMFVTGGCLCLWVGFCWIFSPQEQGRHCCICLDHKGKSRPGKASKYGQKWQNKRHWVRYPTHPQIWLKTKLSALLNIFNIIKSVTNHLKNGDIALPMVGIQRGVIDLPATLPVLSESSSSSWCWWWWWPWRWRWRRWWLWR